MPNPLKLLLFIFIENQLQTTKDTKTLKPKFLSAKTAN